MEKHRWEKSEKRKRQKKEDAVESRNSVIFSNA